MSALGLSGIPGWAFCMNHYSYIWTTWPLFGCTQVLLRDVLISRWNCKTLFLKHCKKCAPNPFFFDWYNFYIDQIHDSLLSANAANLKCLLTNAWMRSQHTQEIAFLWMPPLLLSQLLCYKCFLLLLLFIFRGGKSYLLGMTLTK